MLRSLKNFPQAFLLGGLLLGSLLIAAFYQASPTASPILWALFSAIGFGVVAVVARQSRRIQSSPSETIAGLKVIFGIWTISGVLFSIADLGFSLYPLQVDQISIRIILLMRPFAEFARSLPEPWIPALVAACFFLFLMLIGLADVQSVPSTRVSRLLRGIARPAQSLVGFLKSTGIGRILISAVPAYAKWVTIFKAAAIGVLAFAISLGVGGSSVALRNATILDAFSIQLLNAHAEWRRLEGDVAVMSVATYLEEDWQQSRKCPNNAASTHDRDCEQQTGSVHGFPPEWARTVELHSPPYMPPPPTSGKGPDRPPSPRGEPPGTLTLRRSDATEPITGTQQRSAAAEQARDVPGTRPFRARPEVAARSAKTSQNRLYDQVTASFGGAWDNVGRSVTTNVESAPSFDRVPRDLTPAQIAAARASFEQDMPGGPVSAWSSEFVTALIKAFEQGGVESVKQLVARSVDTVSPVGEVVSEFVDLFLTGPKIEELARTAEEYVRTRRFEPVASFRGRVIQAAQGALGKLRKLWAFLVNDEAAGDRLVASSFLRQEMVDLFNKTFEFSPAMLSAELSHVRESLLAKTIPSDGSFAADTVDQVMAAIASAARLSPPARFERLVALKQFGAETAPLEQLRNSIVSKTAQDALNADSPVGRFTSSELKPGWERAVRPFAMSVWLEGRPASRRDLMRQLDEFLPPTIICGNCVTVPGGMYVSGPHCIRPSDPPPCSRSR